jgi:hypothetical protein
VLDTESTGSTACAFPPVSAARLRALACIFTSRVAYLLARVCRFAIRRRPFGDICLLSYAVADQPRENSAED